MLKENKLKLYVSPGLAVVFLLAAMVSYAATGISASKLSTNPSLSLANLPVSPFAMGTLDKHPESSRQATLPRINAVKRVKRPTTLFSQWPQGTEKQVVFTSATILHNRLQNIPSFENASLKSIRKVVLRH